MDAQNGGAGRRAPRAGATRTSTLPVSELAGVGIQFAAAVVAFTFAGIWVDRRLGTSPIFTLVGVLLGGGGGFYSLYRKLIAAQRCATAGRAAGSSGGTGDDVA